MYIAVKIGELLVFTPAMRRLSWWWSGCSWQESGQTYLEIESFCYMMPNRCRGRGIFYLQIEKEAGRAEHEKLDALLVYSWWWRDESCLLSVMNHEDLMKCHRTALMSSTTTTTWIRGSLCCQWRYSEKKVCQNVTKHDLEMIAFIKLVLRDGIRHVSPGGWRLPTTVLPK